MGRTARRHAQGWLESRSECALGEFYLLRNETERALRHFRASVTALEAVRTQIAPEEIHVSFLRDKLAVVPGATLTALGFQSILSAFFASIIGMKRR